MPLFVSDRGKFAMKLSHFLTASLAIAVVCLVSGAEASPHFQAPTVSLLPLQAGLKCGLVNGHIVCGDSSGKHHDDDDDQQGNDDDHHKKKKKKNSDDDTGLENCTIQSSNSGGGCKGGFKYVCEKLKSGKKCCGCVVDKSAKKEEPKVLACCWKAGTDKLGKVCGEASEARSIASSNNGGVAVTCGPYE